MYVIVLVENSVLLFDPGVPLPDRHPLSPRRHVLGFYSSGLRENDMNLFEVSSVTPSEGNGQ